MVQIITDSAADFEPCELEMMNVKCVPFSVSFGNEEYTENTNLTKRQFYTLLKDKANFPSTAQPSPHSFESVLKNFKDNGCEAVVICLSSALSGACQSAILAKNQLEYDECHIVDSFTASGGERILVEQAVKMRDAGNGAEEIARFLETLRFSISLYACIDSADYLYKGGRISRTACTIASVAHIKPIINVLRNGSINMATKALGIKRAMDFLRKTLEKYPPDKNFPFYIMYTDNKKSGQQFSEYLKMTNLELPDIRATGVGAAVGSHIGPNAFGFAYVRLKDYDKYN